MAFLQSFVAAVRSRFVIRPFEKELAAAEGGLAESGSAPSSRPEEDGVAMANMPAMPHHERHSANAEAIRTIIIGFADGLTVPFALTAGLSAIGSSRLVVIGGLAELFAGAIAMGLGAYLAAATERKSFQVEEARERLEVRTVPSQEEEEIYQIFDQYQLSREIVAPLVAELRKSEDNWVQFMMDFELRMEKPAGNQAWKSAIIMGLSYMLGGIIPMIPYFALQNVTHALFISIGITVVELLVFGYIKAVVTGLKRAPAFLSAAQTLMVGALAAGASYGIVRGVNQSMGGG